MPVKTKWRPEGLVNPYPENAGLIPTVENIASAQAMMYKAWEDACDAMLEKLIEHNQLDHLDVRGIKSR